METLLHTVPAHNSNQLSRAEDQANEIPAEIPAVTNTCQFDSFSGNCFLWRIKVGVSARVCTFLFCVCVCGRVRFIPTGREALACGRTSHSDSWCWPEPCPRGPLPCKHTHTTTGKSTHTGKSRGSDTIRISLLQQYKASTHHLAVRENTLEKVFTDKWGVEKSSR